MATERSIEKDCVRLFGPYFSVQPMRFSERDGLKIKGKTNSGTATKHAGYEIYDTPTQYFLYNKTESSTFSDLDEDDRQVVDKIMKENGFDKIGVFSFEHIVEFRRLFWQFPEIMERMDKVSKKYDDSSYVVLFNLYLAEMVKYKVYTDEVLASLREFRTYIANKGVEFEGEISSDLKNDLYYFLEFDRFEANDYIKEQADSVLNLVCRAIEDGECPDVRTFRTVDDRDQVPNSIVSLFERLVLLNYVWNPDKTVIKETRRAVEQMDLDILKEYLNFRPRGRQKYALIYESRENLAVNCRRCVATHSKIRMGGGSFKEAGELKIGDRLLASDKEGYVNITRLEKRVDMTYKVKLETGEELELTANHRLPTEVNRDPINKFFDSNEDNYKFVSELNTNDRVPTMPNDSDSNYIRSKVVSIEPLYEQEVVDIETDGDSLYWIDSVLSHNSGKTKLVVYLSIRQLFLPRQMILYIVPTKENYSEQPFAYIEGLLDSVKKRGAELPGFSFNSKEMRVTNSVTGSKILFLSGQGSSKGKSFSSNLNIVDEAAFIDDKNLYDQVFNSTADTRGRTRAISTINVETPVNWFFFKKVILDGSKDAKVHNVNIYDNPFIPEEDKAKIEKSFKDRNPEVWLSDWMAIFVGGAEGFDTSKFFKINFLYDVVQFGGQKFNLHRNLESYEKFILFYDPAKTQDKAGVALLGKVGPYAEVLMTGYIHVKNYYTQREILLEMINYLKTVKPTEFGIDLGKAGEAAFDRFENKKVSPYGILSTGGNTYTKNTYRRRNVPASTMESNFNGLISAGVVTGYSWLDEIRNEFDTYSLAKQRKGAVGHHNDVLSALMNACFIWYERGLIKISDEGKPKVENKPLLDAYGRPIRSVKQGQFDGNLLSKFLY